MCDQDGGSEEKIPNSIFHRFRQRLSELNYKIKCRKCQENPGFVLLQKKDVMCGPCLVDYCVHKFRSTIGKSRLVKPDNGILIAFSGGLSSIALVDMIIQGLQADIHRKLRFKSYLLFIDESILSNDKNDLKTSLTPDLFEYMVQSGFECIFTTLQSIIMPDSIRKYFNIHPDSQYSFENLFEFFDSHKYSESADMINKCFSNLHSLSSKYDFLKRLKNLVLVKTAKNLKFEKIFVADTMDDLAVETITNISLGRGVSIKSAINFCDDRYGPSLNIMRPLCEFSYKEIAFYLKFRQLDHISLKSDITATKCPLNSSIHRLTEHFLTQLSDDFPSTFYTVYKTASKIDTKNSDFHSPCKFCLTKMDLDVDESNYFSYNALKFSFLLSNGSESISQNNNDVKDYCYSCLKIKNELLNDKDIADIFEMIHM